MSAATARRNPGISRHAVRPVVEGLEPRVVLSATATMVGDQLSVVGSDGPDRIILREGRAGGPLALIVDGHSVGRFDSVGSISIKAGSGDDLVVVDPRVTLPVRIEGGAGNDRIRGGSGPDLLFGGEGDDLLVGSTGRDGLDAGAGRNRVVVPKHLGLIRVTPSAARSGAVGLLSGTFALTRLGGPASPTDGPIVVGPADLDAPGVVNALRTTYAAGQTVALIGGTEADADRLRGLLGHRNAASLGPAADGDSLVAFRRSTRPDGGTNVSTQTLALDSLNPRAPWRSEGASLSRIFSATSIVPQGTATEPPTNNQAESSTSDLSAPPLEPSATDPTTNLLALTTSYQSSAMQVDAAGDAAEVINMVWGVRSFSQSQDLYYVEQQINYTVGGQSYRKWSDFSYSQLNVGSNPLLIQPSPQTTMEVESVTTGVSFTLGGTAGFNQSQGLNASVNASLTISDSKTVMIPPVQVTFLERMEDGEPTWTYDFREQKRKDGYSNQTATFYNEWIWGVPFSDYTAGQQDVSFETVTSQQLTQRDRSAGIKFGLTSTVPLPFGDTFSLQPPVVSGLSASSVDVGQQFFINGSGFYPSLVSSVLIGGKPLATGQYSVINDSQIKVIAPDQRSLLDQTVVVQTSQGESNDNVSVKIL